MFKLALNTRKFNNYAFFCPVSRLHLTVSSPVGYANEVTPAILKALKAETVLDVDGVIDIKTGTVKGKQAKTAEEKKPAQEAKAPEQKSSEPEKVSDNKAEQEAPVEEKPAAKKGKKAKEDAE